MIIWNILPKTCINVTCIEYGHFGSWYIKSTLCMRFLNWNKIFKKKVVTGKTLFFVIGPFCTPHSICVNIGFWQRSSVWKCCVVVFQLKGVTPVFLKKTYIFQKICFKVKALKTFKISNNRDIKTWRSLKRRAILKVPGNVLKKNICSICWL